MLLSDVIKTSIKHFPLTGIQVVLVIKLIEAIVTKRFVIHSIRNWTKGEGFRGWVHGDYANLSSA